MNNTSAQKKLIIYLKKREPNLSEKDVSDILNSLKRFVNLTRTIYTEPQAIVTFKDRIIKGKTIKDRIFTTNMDELTKVMNKPSEPIEVIMRKLHQSVTKKQNE